jgi:hypothetical protein
VGARTSSLRPSSLTRASAAPPPALTGPSELPRSDFWFPDGTVHTVLQTNGLLYLGGIFENVLRPNAPSSASMDIFSGLPEPDWPLFNGTVHAAVADGLGGWFVGGQFTLVGGVGHTNLVHLRADKSVDPNWAVTPDEAVLALAVSGETLYAGGSFTTLNGQARNYIAAVDALTGALSDWNTGEAFVDPTRQKPVGVRAIVVGQGVVYIAGAFDRLGGVERSNLAALDQTTGRPTDWYPIDFSFPETGQVIDAIALSGNTIYAASSLMAAIDENPRSYLAAFDTTKQTNSLTSWNPSADGPVYSIKVFCDTVYVAGSFTQVGGQPRANLAALDPVTGEARPWNPSANGTVKALAISGNDVLAGGSFTRIGGQPRERLAALDITSGAASLWSPPIGFNVSSLAVAGSRVVAGGTPAGIARRNLVALDIATGKPTDWTPNPSDGVYSLAVSGTNVYVGGMFTEIGGQPRNRLATVSATTGMATPWNPNVGGDFIVSFVGTSRTNVIVESMVLVGNALYIAGSFTNVGAVVRNHLAVVDLTTGLALPWNPDANDTVRTIAVSGNTLYAGGRFTQIGGQTRRRAAALDLTTGAVLPWDPVADDSVRFLLADTDRVYAGGLFSNIGGANREHLAALDPLTGAALAWDPSAVKTNFIGDIPATSYVNTLARSGSTLYVGGLFNQIGGQPRENLAAVDVTTGLAQAWNPRADLPGIGLAVTGDTVYAGGVFKSIAGAFQPFFAAFPPVGAPTITANPLGQIVSLGEPASFSVSATGDPPLSYSWRHNGAIVAGATNATLSIASAQIANAGVYEAVVSNALGLINSVEATLVVLEPLVITSQPGVPYPRGVPPGATVTLGVGVTGNPPPTYQWRLNGVNIPGAVYATLTISNAQPASSGNYSVVAANVGGSVASEVAAVQVRSVSLTLADTLANRTTLTAGSGVRSGSNTSATKETGEPNHAGKAGGKSMWVGWRAPASGVATFSTRGSDFDTLLAAYTGGSVGSLGEQAADDDRGGFLTSEVVFNAVAGTEYLIAVDGFAGASGRIVLSWSLDTSASDLPRILAQPLSQTVTNGASVTFAVSAASQTALAYQWLFNCDAPIPGATNATLTITNVHVSDVGLYLVRITNALNRSVESLPAFLELGPDPKAQSQDKLQDLFAGPPSSLAPASVFHRRKTGFPTVSAGVPGTQNLNNFDATTEAGEPLHASVIGGASRWFKLTAAQNGVFEIDTLGSDIDTVLAVYTGADFAGLSLVASDNNGAPDGIRSRVRFNAVNGTDYLVAMDGVNGAHGNIQLNWKLGTMPVLAQAPTNQSARQYETVSLVAAVTGTPAVSYQWQLNGTNLAGATNAVLVLGSIQLNQAGRYSVVAGNFVGSVTSADAVVTVMGGLSLNPNASAFTNGTFRLLIDGLAGETVVVQAATNLASPVAWVPIYTNSGVTGAMEFIDQNSTNFPRRFYRAVLGP